MTKAEKIKQTCPGCRYNRYNQPTGFRETEYDAPVSGEGCWFVNAIRYDRHEKKYTCPHKS